MPRGGGDKRVRPLRTQDGVAVDPGLGPPAGVETSRRPRCLSDGYRRREELVDGPLQAGQVRVGPDVEAHHLSPGVHAGIGASGAGELDRVAEDALQGLGERPSHCWDLALKGKTVERRAQVGDEQTEAPALYWYGTGRPLDHNLRYHYAH
jgi:hypothetical protein